MTYDQEYLLNAAKSESSSPQKDDTALVVIKNTESKNEKMAGIKEKKMETL